MLKNRMLFLAVFFGAFVSTQLFGEVHDYHGVDVLDPYYCFEDSSSKECMEFLAVQREKSSKYFDDEDEKQQLRKSLVKHIPDKEYGMPVERNGAFFFIYRDKDRQKHVIASLDEDKRLKVIVDVSDQENISIKGFVLSDDGNMLAYGLTDSGSDKSCWKFFDIEKNIDLGISVQNIIIAPIFDKGSAGVYYVDGMFSSIKYVNFKENTDRKIYETIDKSLRILYPRLVQEGKNLLFTTITTKERKNGFSLLSLEDGTIKEIIPMGLSTFSFICEKNKEFYFQTNYLASNARLIKIDFKNPDKNNWQEVVQESDYPLESVCITRDYICCSYLKDCMSKIKIYDLSGQFFKDIALPGMGNVAVNHQGLKLLSVGEGNQFIYPYIDFITPRSFFSCNIDSEDQEVLFSSSIDQKSSDYEVRQEFFQSIDGTYIPMFIVKKRHSQLNGNTPTLMYGYGGFNIPITNSYSPMVQTWLDNGGIYVSVNLRGGSEYGENWNKMGKLFNKQNVFDDFTCAAQWLIDHKYTCSEKLAIYGASNGGLLVGAMITQRPDLFKAGISFAGVLDMIRFSKYTAGQYWIHEYGDPDNKDAFSYLHSYSPYHNVQTDKKYPSTLLLTGECDDRVVPMHSYKFAAKLEETKTVNPIILKTYPDSGHKGPASQDHKVKLMVDLLYFLKKELK